MDGEAGRIKLHAECTHRHRRSKWDRIESKQLLLYELGDSVNVQGVVVWCVATYAFTFEENGHSRIKLPQDMRRQCGNLSGLGNETARNGVLS